MTVPALIFWTLLTLAGVVCAIGASPVAGVAVAAWVGWIFWLAGRTGRTPFVEDDRRPARASTLTGGPIR